MGRLMRRLDWTFYPGIALLAAAVIQPFALPQQSRLWWPLVIAGLVLVAVSLIPWALGARTALGGRTVRYGFNTLVMVVLVLGIIGVVEALSYRHNARLDLTENRRHSLSLQTIQLLKGLPTKVNAVAFYRGDQPGKRLAEDLFKQYARYGGDKFTWKSVDPDREPTLAKAFGVEAYGTTVLEAKGRTEKVLDADQEEKLTNGLVKVTRDSKRVVYITQGHGEPEITNTERTGFSEAKGALDKANYEAKPLALARQGKVPDDASVVIIAGPRNDFFGPEIDALDAYLGRGGKLLAMVNPPFPEKSQAESVKKLLGKYGFTLGEDLVIELNPIGQLFGIGPQVPIVQQYESHPITRDMAGITTLFPLTRSVGTASPPPAGVTLQALAKTTPDSWGETDRQALERGQAKPDPQDVKGPLTLAAVATKDKARIVVYGTANLAGNQFLNVQGNRDFFLNTVSWLAEQEDQIAVRPKDTKQTPVFLTSQQAQAVFWLPVVILPAIGMVGGIIAVARRRAAK
ncbi:MAG TPA: GldG family protein [Candidatus Limnocylindria bacterium]|nr:GldG family protein [Candidatus Limnocylindria bacterium]